MQHFKYLIFCLLLFGLPIIAAQLITKTNSAANAKNAKLLNHQEPKSISAENYAQIIDSLNTKRIALQQKYIHAKTENKKQNILSEAEKLFTGILLNDIINAWYGTPWEFYGKTEIPNQGTIACGYFVTTVLRDAGVKLDRVHLAEIKSETMIRTFINAKYIKRYRNISWRDFLGRIKAGGDAFYVIGLDYHTGFLLCKAEKVYFINANIPGVMKENAESAYMLCVSRYRVTGRLTNNADFTRKWLLGKDFPNLTSSAR